MKKSLSFVMALLMLTSTFGCSAFAPKTQRLSVSCDEGGVKLQINGNMYNCPTQIDVPRNNSVGVMAYKPGYHSYMRTIDSKPNGLFVLDVVGGIIWLVPFVGLVTPGAYSIETQNINVSMVALDNQVPLTPNSSNEDNVSKVSVDKSEMAAETIE